MKSLAAGVPLVCMPLGRDQAEVARHVQLTEAGRTVPKNASAQKIADAVRQVLDDPSHLHEARRLTEKIAAEAATAIGELEDPARQAGNPPA